MGKPYSLVVESIRNSQVTIKKVPGSTPGKPQSIKKKGKSRTHRPNGGRTKKRLQITLVRFRLLQFVKYIIRSFIYSIL